MRGVSLALFLCNLLLNDLQNLHGAGLDTDTAGDALGNRIAILLNHDLHGACFHALAAADAELLIDHVHTGLGILGNCPLLADFHALAALDTDIGLSACALGNDLDAGQVGIELLIKSLRATLDTLQACHALGGFIDSEFFHFKLFSFYRYCVTYYTHKIIKCNLFLYFPE